MEAAVPGEIVDARGGLEKDHRRARGGRFAPRHLPSHAGYFEIVEPADQSAFDALFIEFSKHLISAYSSEMGSQSPILSVNFPAGQLSA